MADGLARFPQRTMLADRRAAIEGQGMTLEEGLALEAEAGQMLSLTYTPTAVPEPGTLALASVAAIGWVTFWRRRWAPVRVVN